MPESSPVSGQPVEAAPTMTAPAAPTSVAIFALVVERGAIFIDVCDRPLIAFRPGHFLAIGSLEILGAREAERRHESAVAIGRVVGRRESAS